MRGSLIARQVKRDKLSESLRIYRQFERQLCWPSTSKFVASSYNFSSLLLLPFTTVVLFITWEQVSEETKMVIACSSFAWVYTHCCAILVVYIALECNELKGTRVLIWKLRIPDRKVWTRLLLFAAKVATLPDLSS